MHGGNCPSATVLLRGPRRRPSTCCPSSNGGACSTRSPTATRCRGCSRRSPSPSTPASTRPAEPAGGQPAAAVHAAAVPGGGPPADRARRRWHRHDRRPGRQDRGAHAPHRASSSRRTSRPCAASSSASSTSRGGRGLLLDNARLAGRAAPARLPARRRQALHREPDVAKESVKVPVRGPRPGHLLHRVQLHAAAGLRLPPPVRHATAAGCSSAAATSGATSPWASSSSASCATRRRSGSRRRSCSTPTAPSWARPRAARCGSTRSARRPYQLYQFFVRTDDAMVTSYLRYFTWLDHGRIRELDQATADHPERREAQQVLAKEVTALVHGDRDAGAAVRAARRAVRRRRAGRARRGRCSGRCSATRPPRPGPAPSSTAPGVPVVELAADERPRAVEARPPAASIKGRALYVNNTLVTDESTAGSPAPTCSTTVGGAPAGEAQLPGGRVRVGTLYSPGCAALGSRIWRPRGAWSEDRAAGGSAEEPARGMGSATLADIGTSHDGPGHGHSPRETCVPRALVAP